MFVNSVQGVCFRGDDFACLIIYVIYRLVKLFQEFRIVPAVLYVAFDCLK